MKGCSLVFLLIFFCLWASGQTEKDDRIFVTGVVCDRDSVQPLPEAIWRLGQEAWGVDAKGRFSVRVHVGDTLRFSHVGYEPVEVIVSDTLRRDDYLLGVFLVRDTVLLAEVLIMPRFFTGGYKSDPYLLNARNNFNQALYAASQPVEAMDREMNRKMALEDFARKVEMKGMVDVKLGVGTQTLSALQGLLRTRRQIDRGKVIRIEEVDLLRKIFYIEKREKSDN